MASLVPTVVESGRRATARLPGRWGRRVRESAKWIINYNDARASGLRGWTFARAGRHSDLLVAPFGRGRLLVDASDEEIGRVVYMRGDYERNYMAVALDQLRGAGLVPDGRTFVDVGANIGTTTIDALLQFGFADAVCFEPDPRNVRLLRMNLVLNDVDERAVVHPVAASDRDDLVTVYRQPGNFGDSRVDADGSIDGESVSCVQIDSLIADGSLDPGRVGLVWIDAQGHDARVLNGATAITSAGVPIFVEYWPDGLGDGADRELLENIVADNYSRVIDLRVAASGRGSADLPAANIRHLRDRYGRAQHTDHLLLR